MLSKKLRRMMQVVLLGFMVISLRVWHLEVVQRDEKVRLSQQPKRRVLLHKADRGILVDRFNKPLAVNKICYNAVVYYNQIGALRSPERKAYIQRLSEKLAPLLGLDAPRIDDLIHSKASLFPHVPFLLKSGLTESEYYQLAALEREWPGLHAEVGSERFYPQGKVASELIGSMGSIPSKKYLAQALETQMLQQIVDDWELGASVEIPAAYGSFDGVLKRLEELKEKAYTLQDLVGMSGLEAQAESKLRGSFGKDLVECDHKGNYLRPLAGGKPAVSGQTVQLSISAELQEFAESLLAHDEGVRQGKSIGLDPLSRERKVLKQPWIKGGAIVAMDPTTGEILAMASTPRFDPNDFIHKEKRVHRWLETEKLIGAIWDGEEPLVRERYSKGKGWHEESIQLSWEHYLSELTPLPFPVHDVKTAVQLQEDIETLLYHTRLKTLRELLDGPKPTQSEALVAWRRVETLLASLPSTDERLFAIDLCRLVVHAPAFTDHSLKVLGPMKLSKYRSLTQALCQLAKERRAVVAKAFRDHEFRLWREAHQKEFLATIRASEKKRKAPPRPYLDLLDQKERELFQIAWDERKLDILAAAILDSPECACLVQPSQEETKEVLHTFRSFAELQRPLFGRYATLRGEAGQQTERDLAAAFYPKEGFGMSRSWAFQASAPPGSIFKLVGAYAGLLKAKGANPLTIVDEWRSDGGGTIVASTPSGAPYHRMYKGGRLPKSSSGHLGKLDVVAAIERSSNPYFALLAGDVLREPEELWRAARSFGYGTSTGVELPAEVSGNLPGDLGENRTGLYSTAIGQHTLLATPLQTAVMLSAIANKGKVLKPVVVKETRGELSSAAASEALAASELAKLGIPYALFDLGAPSPRESATRKGPDIIRNIELPTLVRSQLLEGMDHAVWSERGSARPVIIRNLVGNAKLTDEFLALRHQMLGKTSTAEILYNPYVNPSSAASMYKHIWFGAMSFEDADRWEKPELVVVVYLRFGDAGREAAPMAAQVINKWREIKGRN